MFCWWSLYCSDISRVGLPVKHGNIVQTSDIDQASWEKVLFISKKVDREGNRENDANYLMDLTCLTGFKG